MGVLKDFASRLEPAASKATLRVRVVDDEEPIRRFVRRALQDAGYEISAAGGGAEARALIDAGHPVDVLVTDLMMPEMTGDELARRLRQSEPALKVLYLTGFSDKL